ncbi:putative mitochondrial hypothetical protein [Leptomonas pyrrhocoris]|uniref:Uncharacterized protein n=1 Tax=Leptomonas pyrrhocoris TaxID=157538 RepID=A0A0N0VEJ3_LEPPY|nr:putative mitochondrial hypothetical protein [Leptomonas pyrrhocoris]KPA78521.1 putative mitochondrial hypothetical protein [Leptomonas pyrrhocoris]|eukprot:XP_015656960.1 putative mitochondrial hypothetical protein [Leptomonas pyrrhocoris]
MPPLTLEQVLARSMRLPRQRTQRYVSKLYHGSNSTAVDAHAQRATRAGALASGLTEPGLFHPSHSDVAAPHRRGMKELAAPARQEKLNFFDLMEREDALRRAGRLSIHRSDHLVRNSTDLTTFLNAAARTGGWQDGLRAFAEATALPAFQALLHESTAIASASGDSSTQWGSSNDRASPTDDTTAAAVPSHSPSAPSVSLSGVNPNAAHIVALLNMCATAGQYPLVEKIGAFFAPAFPDAFARVVELLAARAADTDAAAAPGWRAAFVYLTQRCPLPAAEVPVEAFNVCLRGCEEVKDWRGALEVVRSMGPNPMQGWTSAEEEKDATQGEHTASSSSATAGTESPSPHEEAAAPVTPAQTSLSTPPPPNVVSYATLIATLEQAGKDQLASEVLNRLPAVEKEEITASYAALIFVWSNQVLHKHRRRF